MATQNLINVLNGEPALAQANEVWPTPHERYFLRRFGRTHNQLVGQVFENRGFDRQEAKAVAEFAAFATRHGVRTHNALKALHLDELFGSAVGGCKPRAQVEIKSPGSMHAKLGTLISKSSKRSLSMPLRPVSKWPTSMDPAR